MPCHLLKTFATTFSVAAVVLSSAAACRAESLPEPTGAYPIGRITYHLVDASRERQDQGSNNDHKREFMVQLWYPAEAGTAGKPTPWVPADQLSHEEKGFVGMVLRKSSAPSAKDVTKVMTSVVVHAREDVPLADSPKHFPVILFAAGSQQIPWEYSCLA